MVAARLKIELPMLKAPPVAKKRLTHRQNLFSEHQYASTADVLTGAWGILQKAHLIT
jgi:hypothetical protein